MRNGRSERPPLPDDPDEHQIEGVGPLRVRGLRPGDVRGTQGPPQSAEVTIHNPRSWPCRLAAAKEEERLGGRPRDSDFNPEREPARSGTGGRVSTSIAFSRCKSMNPHPACKHLAVAAVIFPYAELFLIGGCWRSDSVACIRTRPLQTAPGVGAFVGAIQESLTNKCCKNRQIDRVYGGEGGIRTPGTLASTPHFECGAIDHSATSPEAMAPCGEARLLACTARVPQAPRALPKCAGMPRT